MTDLMTLTDSDAAYKSRHIAIDMVRYGRLKEIAEARDVPIWKIASSMFSTTLDDQPGVMLSSVLNRMQTILEEDSAIKPGIHKRPEFTTVRVQLMKWQWVRLDGFLNRNKYRSPSVMLRAMVDIQNLPGDLPKMYAARFPHLGRRRIGRSSTAYKVTKIGDRSLAQMSPWLSEVAMLDRYFPHVPMRVAAVRAAMYRYLDPENEEFRGQVASMVNKMRQLALDSRAPASESFSIGVTCSDDLLDRFTDFSAKLKLNRTFLLRAICRVLGEEAGIPTDGSRSGVAVFTADSPDAMDLDYTPAHRRRAHRKPRKLKDPVDVESRMDLEFDEDIRAAQSGLVKYTLDAGNGDIRVVYRPPVNITPMQTVREDGTSIFEKPREAQGMVAVEAEVAETTEATLSSDTVEEGESHV